ncbi:TonB-dependent siderophore receptor [Novosphingobium sp. PP1Y]|uniref:TonB-dependent receptor n=1 Tax=Novosphingobium sp. PP1Y TaxID=702113 RepID=UPI00020EEAF5|nr:TonB-dependent siderophore receptor [Novosphingobium sp. PP1Y]CCA92021.1 TonB-dependent siderophore receptor [Novosphingobium sp. PP1Y]
MTRTRITGGQAAASFVALSCVGFIATAPVQVSAQEAKDQPVRLEGVSVTESAIEEDYGADRVQSPKSTAPLIDTPRTVNVITTDVLKDTASFDFADALRTVPGITLGAGEGGVASADIPLIRGVDATSDTYVDGARDVGSQTRETFAVERIEVFKGSTGAFGGRGSAGGAINIVSKMPRDGNFANADVTVGTDDFKRVAVDVNQKLAEKLAVRINGMWHDADVAGRDAVFNKRWGIAPSVTWGIGTETTATLSYYHYETDDMPDYGIPITSRGQLDGVLPEGSRRPADTDYDNFYGLADRDFQKTKVDSVTFQFQHDFGRGWVLSNTARWSRVRNDYIVTNPDDSKGNVANGLVWRGVKSRNSLNQSLVNNLNLAGRFKTGGIEHSIAMGFEMSASDTDRYSYSVDTGDSTCASLADYNCTTLDNPNPSDPWTGTITLNPDSGVLTRAEDYSFYAFDTVTIIPQLLVNGGVRWTSFNIRASGSSRGVPYSVDKKTDFWTWQGGVVFKPVENASIYFSYADSATPPGADVGEGANAVSGTNANYEPQTMENWEVGAKADLLGGALSLTAAAFQIDRSNIRDFNPETGDQMIIANKARIKGFEVGASGRVGPVSLLAGYSYTDSSLRDSSADNGNALPNTPKHNVALTSTVDVTDRFSIGGGAYHASKRYADTANLIEADGYWRFDANAGFRFNENFSVKLNLRNLTDKRYVTKLRNPHFAVPSAGRQALVTLSASY